MVFQESDIQNKNYFIKLPINFTKLNIIALSAMNARMIGFDIFFPEASATEILKKQDLAGAQVKSVDDVLDLFRDYDRDLRESMNNAGNVFLGQSFQIAANQEDADWIRENIGEKNENNRN